MATAGWPHKHAFSEFVLRRHPRLIPGGRKPTAPPVGGLPHIRRFSPMPRKRNAARKACDQCGGPIHGRGRRFCSTTCYGLAQRVPRGGRRSLSKQRHGVRVRDVPGIARASRRSLLAAWQQQGRRCIYCGTAAADTIDHVVPLSRGGTNFEGNLAPACRACNASKCDMLIVEWRSGRGPGATVSRVWRSVPPHKAKAVRGVQQVISVCYICGEMYQGERMTCGDKGCQREHSGRQVRDRYRAEHGHPVDPTEPTLYWIRLRGLPDTRTRANRRAAA